MIIKKMKKAFSLIEVIFVLVILGVVASISSQIIVQVYENYITQKAVYNVSNKTELASNQIVNRLTYRIPNSTISKNHDLFVANPTTTKNEGVDWRRLEDVQNGGSIFTTIEWIGYDNDSFSAEQTPGWSGISDYQSPTSDSTQFLTPGSNLALTATILSNISTDESDTSRVALTAGKPAAVVFNEKNNFYSHLPDQEYHPICMGLIPNGRSEDGINSSTNCIFAVAQNGNNILSFVNAPNGDNSLTDPKIISERYKLASSAYTLAPVPNPTTNLHDLVLYSNYQPWNGESYLDPSTTRNTILRNISVFKFSENGGTIKFKLCASENIGQDFNITTCKEKVIIR